MGATWEAEKRRRIALGSLEPVTAQRDYWMDRAEALAERLDAAQTDVEALRENLDAAHAVGYREGAREVIAPVVEALRRCESDWSEEDLTNPAACVAALNQVALEYASRAARAEDRCSELEDALRNAGSLLDRAASDISQTARANQMGLTGVDPVFPDDPPIQSLIGRHHVHQAGIDESLRVRDKCRNAVHGISALIDAAREESCNG